MMTHCDMCGTEIKDMKCSCGIWLSEEVTQDNPLKKALEYFHEMKKFTLTADMPQLGCGVVFFRGGYNDCKKIERFIHDMNGRPHYEE